MASRAATEAKIDRVKQRGRPGPKIDVRKKDGNVITRIGATDNGGMYDIVFVTFDKDHFTEIKPGEKRGRTLVAARVVREYEILGTWSGKPADLRIPKKVNLGKGDCCLIVQKCEYGEIVVAVSLPFDS